MIADTENRTPPAGTSRRDMMRQRTIEFRKTQLGVPARIRPEDVMALLGIHGLVLASMTAAGLVSCLGTPRNNGTRRYYGPYVLALRQNTKFLDEVERYARWFWKARSERANLVGVPSLVVAREWVVFHPKSDDTRHLIGIVPPVTIDPVLGIGAAGEILGFADHEIRLLVRQKHLPAAGDTTERFVKKRFHFAQLLDCHRNYEWVERAEQMVVGYWRRKNHTNCDTSPVNS